MHQFDGARFGRCRYITSLPPGVKCPQRRGGVAWSFGCGSQSLRELFFKVATWTIAMDISGWLVFVP